MAYSPDATGREALEATTGEYATIIASISSAPSGPNLFNPRAKRRSLLFVSAGTRYMDMALPLPTASTSAFNLVRAR